MVDIWGFYNTENYFFGLLVMTSRSLLGGY